MNSQRGAPSIPIRLMAGCLLLKHLYNLGVRRTCERPHCSRAFEAPVQSWR
ncbi:transposase [Bacteroides pyogenes]|uniref:transposase n=1 Tax=Bacteroides pyogenes TaxID=310300 RepID=UPI003B428EE6